MQNFECLSIRVKHNELQIIDQTKLPHEEHWVTCSHPDIMIDAIKKLKVRGAPLIGVAAALSLAQFVESGASQVDFKEKAAELKKSRPTAVNLMWAVDRLLSVSFDRVIQTAYFILEEDIALCEGMATHGVSLIQDGDSILTHCNTGGLATAGIGTALSVIIKAHQSGKKIHVYVDETRPLLQGGRLTTWELGKRNIPYTLICDSMAAQLMRDGKIQKVFLGSDRIALNGDFANKIGTYSVAVNAYHHKIPFYVVAPRSTIDFSCENGNQIPIEERDPAEVQGVTVGVTHPIRWSPQNASVYNPAFDVTPAQLVTGGWVLDCGFFNFEQIKEGSLRELNQLNS